MLLLVTVYILILFFYYYTSLFQFLGVKAILASYKEGVNKGYQKRVLVFMKKERDSISIYKEGEKVVNISY